MLGEDVMIQLKEIQDYVQNTVEIISSVLDMEVIIVDSDRCLLGDNNPYPENNQIETTSILNVVMNKGKSTVLESIDDNPGCLICKNRQICKTESIIGFPIIYKSSTIGAIGILAMSLEAKQILLDKKDYFLKFIQQMSEQLISKLEERESNIKLQQLQKQMICIINSIENGILATDEFGHVIYYNTLILDFFDADIISQDNIALNDLLDETYTSSLITADEGFRNKEVVLQRDGKSVYALLTGRPIIMDGQSIGSILLFKKMSDVYREVVELSDNGIISGFDSILGNSLQITEVKQKASRIARGNSTVLIQGESGTGKELFARAIHNNSNISEKPFIAVNCAAIPDTLLESELFGYDEGAFTGAKKGGKIGKFELANGGTIFLDEIGEMPLPLQAKLLRVLQERYIERIGSNISISIEVRVIAASNKNLEDLIKGKQFREDLYYRLNVIPLNIPPLRERPGDIITLLYHFLSLYNRRLGQNIKGFTEDAEQVLTHYDWKGNVRELQNAVEYAVNMSEGEYIGINDIDINLSADIDFSLVEQTIVQIKSMDELLKIQILDALKIYGISVEGKLKTAKALGLSIATLYRKMKQLKIPL